MTTGPRVDHNWIVGIVPQQARVLDLGCGDGTLLARLERENDVKGIGIEIEPICVQTCIGQGLSVIQADIDEGLQDYPDEAFDFVVLCRTFHLVKRPVFVLAESLRVGSRVLVSFENEAFWKKRLSFLVRGDLPADGGEKRIPEVVRLRNFLTVAKMEALINAEGIHVEKRLFSGNSRGGQIRQKPNIRSHIALYILQRANN